jgi:diguanylate cyclase (GGDEF)-like protein/PAS domain S-box-containing protein
VSAWYDRVHPADRAAYLEAEDRRERCQRGYAIEFRYLHAQTGALHWARETAAAPYRAASGRWLLHSYILDITEQKRAEERLRASEERYRAIVEDQSECIRRFDPDGRLTFVNGALCRLLRQPREHLLGADLLALLPEQDAHPLRRRLWALTRARPTVGYELEVTLPDGSRRWQEWTDRAIFDEAGQIQEYQSVGRDVTERKLAEQQARYLSQHDPLTDLPNRALLEEHLRQAVSQARRDRRRVAVLLLDLDGFKRVNDTQGHQIGDRLLRAVGQRLRASVRASDVVARLGGDEFAVVLTAIDEPGGAMVSAGKLIEALARPFDLGGEPMLLAASGGAALFPDHADTPVGLIHAAVADDVGLGLKLDRWAIEKACRRAVRWRRAGLVSKIAVNLAAGQVNEPRLPAELERILEQTGLEPRDLELELSEHTVIDAGSEPRSPACAGSPTSG